VDSLYTEYIKLLKLRPPQLPGGNGQAKEPLIAQIMAINSQMYYGDADPNILRQMSMVELQSTYLQMQQEFSQMSEPCSYWDEIDQATIFISGKYC